MLLNVISDEVGYDEGSVYLELHVQGWEHFGSADRSVLTLDTLLLDA